jgi:thioredoxin reductase (NADPH)
MSKEKNFLMISTELLIIGCGPAGMMAAIYAKRANKKVIIIEKSSPGGRVRSTYQVENYLGFGRVNAEELVNNMVTHLKQLGIDDDFGSCQQVTILDNRFYVKTEDQEYLADAVIVASGTRPKPIGCLNEQPLLSRGVSYCAICDGIFYENMPVLVVGGGDSALEEALYLANVCSKVDVVHDLAAFTASQGVVQKVLNHPKITVRPHTIVKEFLGKSVLEGALLENIQTHTSYSIAVNGAFIYVGNQPETAFLSQLSVTDEQGYIIVGTEMSTCVPGLFAAGDVTKKDYRLIATAISDGAIAALSAVKYLDGILNKG